MAHRITTVSASMTLLTASFLFAAGTSSAQAPTATPDIQISGRCSDVLKDCLGGPAEGRTRCLFATAFNNLCRQTALGDLIYKRAVLSPDRKAEYDPSPNPPAAQFVDRECLRNFDNQLSSDLILGELSEATTARLGERLEDCTLDSPLDVTRQ